MSLGKAASPPPNAARRQTLVGRLRQPGIVAAILLIGLTGGLVSAFVYARGELAGADAFAYWYAVHAWLAGADYYAPPPPTLPYAYAPWTLFVFVPWALLPWDIAWFGWRAVNVVLFALSVAIAYRWRPLPTAILLAIVGPALAANLDTGNINILMVLGIWVAYLRPGRLGGFIWGLATGIKWVTLPFVALLAPRARTWGLLVVGIAAVLTLANWPLVLHQLDVLVNYPRPVRVDYMIFLWVLVPWLWRQAWPPWWLQWAEIGRRWRTRPSIGHWLRQFFGLA